MVMPSLALSIFLVRFEQGARPLEFRPTNSLKDCLVGIEQWYDTSRAGISFNVGLLASIGTLCGQR